MLEHEDNIAHHLRRGFDAQWNDDAHHVVHSMLTGEADGYYADYADRATPLLARCLAEGFAYQGECSAVRKGEPRGTPSADLPPTAFVFFLQNHDQIGNRPFGERLLSLAPRPAVVAAVALQLLCPHIPLLFMGEEDASPTPFLYFTDHHGRACRRRSRRPAPGICRLRRIRGGRDARDHSRPQRPGDLRATADPYQAKAPQEMRALYAELLRLRRSSIVPRLDGAALAGRRGDRTAAVVARWTMGDSALLTVAGNLGKEEVALPHRGGEPIFASSPAHVDGWLLATSTMVFLETTP